MVLIIDTGKQSCSTNRIILTHPSDTPVFILQDRKWDDGEFITAYPIKPKYEWMKGCNGKHMYSSKI